MVKFIKMMVSRNEMKQQTLGDRTLIFRRQEKNNIRLNR